MAQISKFLFETDFAAPVSDRVKTQDETEVEPPMFSEAELLSAREHGYEAGIAAGQAQALAGIEKRIGEVIASIDVQFAAVAKDVAGQKALATQDVAILAGAIATKVTGTKSNKSRLDLLEQMITNSVAKLYQAPEITARVPADIEPDLSSLLAMSELAITVNVIPDQTLSGTDCHITWHGGGAERIEARIWQDVEALLEHYVAGPAETETADDTATDEVDKNSEAAPADSAALASEPVNEDITSDERASDGGGHPTEIEPTLEPDGGPSTRPAPGDQDG